MEAYAKGIKSIAENDAKSHQGTEITTRHDGAKQGPKHSLPLRLTW